MVLACFVAVSVLNTVALVVLWISRLKAINHAGFLEREVQLLHELSDSTRDALDYVGSEAERANTRIDSLAEDEE